MLPEVVASHSQRRRRDISYAVAAVYEGVNELPGREDSPPKLGGVAAPSRNAAKPPKHGADGVVPQQNPASTSFGTTPPARPFLEFDGLAGTPPNLGGEFQTPNWQFIHTFYERRYSPILL